MAESEADLRARLDRLAGQIEKLKSELGHGMEPETINRLMELGSILDRHREIVHRSGEPEAGRPKPASNAELAADLKVVEETLRGWIDRPPKARGG